MEFLNQLNESQRKAVEYIDGASLVIAGAGSGKTRVLTFKIAYLLANGYKPWEIMALTFTNKAAREMKERIIAIVGADARSLQMGTFHSIFSRILRVHAEKVGYSSNFTIYDENDSRSLCKSIVKQFGLDEKVYKPADVHNRISWAKNQLMLPEQYDGNPKVIGVDADRKMPEMSRIYKQYVADCRKSNAMDFDDLLLYTFLLFKNNEDVRKKFQEHFRFVLVDEYQDTNYAQQQIVWQLCSVHQHICVVGDDAQSIYGFRGADIDNILDFQNQYAGSKMFKLEQNYRSTQRIVQAANSLIQHNNRQIKKDVFSCNDEGDKLLVHMLTSDKEEAISVCREIRNGIASGENIYSDFAILYRTNYQSRTFEEQLLKDSIPYRIYGGMSFYQRKEIKDIVAYYRLVVNPHDEEAFRRVINYPARGIGDTTVNKLIASAQQNGESLWTISSNPVGFNVNINKGAIAKLAAFRDMIEGFQERMATDDAYELGRDIIKQTGISADLYNGTNPDDLSRQENLGEFLSSLQDFVEGNREQGEPTGLADFLLNVSLMSDRDNDADDDTNRVTLMTIHSAKGLEFPVVYVVGLEENIFPSPMCTESARMLEEERRLLYVAITRAEKRCILTCAKSRFRFGRMEFDAPSRFLKDIDPQLLKIQDSTADEDSSYRSRRGGNGYGYGGYGDRYSRMQNSNPVASQFKADPKPKEAGLLDFPAGRSPFREAYERKEHDRRNMRPLRNVVNPRADITRNTGSASSSANAGALSLTVGDMIEHARFGKGTILKIDGSGDSCKITVEFVNAGAKQLLLKFAKIKKL